MQNACSEFRGRNRLALRFSFLNLMLTVGFHTAGLQGFAGPSTLTKDSSPNTKANWQQTIQPFIKSQQTRLVFLKVQISKVMGGQKVHEGEIIIGSDKFRIETKVPDLHQIIFDGRQIWSIQHPPPEFGGDVEVSRLKMNDRNQQHFVLFQVLKGRIRGVYKVSSKKSRHLLRAIRKTTQPQEIEIVVDSKNAPEEIAWTDEIGNRTEFKIKQVEFHIPKDDSLFSYKPPKNIKVMEM